MHFDAHHRVLTGVEPICRALEKLGCQVELRELRFLAVEVFLAEICEQPPVPGASTQQPDGPLELLPLGARGGHARKNVFYSFGVRFPSSVTVARSETSARDQ